MKIETFELERIQSLWENLVEINLTESGIHPYRLDEILSTDEIAELDRMRIGYGQTNGSIELREAIVALYRDADLDNVLVTTGSAEANFVAMWNLLEAGDELVLMLPNYLQIQGIAKSFGVEVKPFRLREELDWAPDLDELRAAVSPRTKVIVLCNPNNPTGSLLSAASMREITSLAAENDAWIYVDEVYRGAELNLPPEESSPSFWDFASHHDKVIVTGGLSKAYALPGLRVGWLVGPHGTITDMWARRDYTTIATNIISNRVGARVLQADKRPVIFERNRAMLRQNLVTTQAWVESHGGLLHFVPPKAGGMAFIRYNFDINSTDLSLRLRESKGTFIIAGDCFGMDGYLRIGMGGEPDQLVEGLQRVDEVIADLAR